MKAVAEQRNLPWEFQGTDMDDIMSAAFVFLQLFLQLTDSGLNALGNFWISAMGFGDVIEPFWGEVVDLSSLDRKSTRLNSSH